MKKVLFVLMAAMLIVSCQSKGNKVEVTAESLEDSLFVEPDSTIGEMITQTYEGSFPDSNGQNVDYLLMIETLPENGDGMYTLIMTTPATVNSKATTTTTKGKTKLLKGEGKNKGAVIRQLIPTDGGKKINFLAEGDSALVKLDHEFKKAMSDLNHTFKLVK
ncbi:MAG: copper homeostasis protein [Bacteroides sp.]